MSNNNQPNSKKVFILTRRDLSHGQRVVQACHALALLMRKQGHDPWLQEWADEHKTLIILGVRDVSDLLRWEEKLRDAQLRYELFEEPDRRGEATAIAIHPAADPYLFRNLRLV